MARARSQSEAGVRRKPEPRGGPPGAPELSIRNRRSGRRIATRRLREITLALLRDELGAGMVELGIHLVGACAMARLNWRWLRHEGSTDIITFDHREEAEIAAAGGPGPRRGRGATIRGECFISVDDAVEQAAQFGTTADEELVRYVVHGVLHLLGYDDLEPSARRVMKREENRLVRRLARRGPLTGMVGKRG